MPLNYNAVEEYHVRLDKNGELNEGRIWLSEESEWQIEIQEGSTRLSAPQSPQNIMVPFQQFGRMVSMVEQQAARLRTCGTCSHFRRSPHENAEGWMGYCTYRHEATNDLLERCDVSLLSADCYDYQQATQTPPVIPLQQIAPDGKIPDPELTKQMPIFKPTFSQKILNSLRTFFGLGQGETEYVRAGVVERPGGQPCAVCGTRMTNRASVANADKRGNERVLSVWACPHCSTNYLDDWFEAFVGSRARDGERLYVVPPVEANEGAAIVVNCPRPDVKGCNCIANQHFDKWGNALEKAGRRIKHRESVVSL